MEHAACYDQVTRFSQYFQEWSGQLAEQEKGGERQDSLGAPRKISSILEEEMCVIDVIYMLAVSASYH